MNLQRGDVLTVRTAEDESYNEIDESMGISDGCWSAPGQFFDDEDSDLSDSNDDLDDDNVSEFF